MEDDSFNARDDLDGFTNNLEEEFDPDEQDKKLNGMSRDDYYVVEDIYHGFGSNEEGDLKKLDFNKENELLDSGKEGFKIARGCEGTYGALPFSLITTSAKTIDVINASFLPANLCFYSFEEIQTATQDIDEYLILGVSGFGKVYLGEIDDGTMKVALAATISSGRGPWCVAKPEAPREVLQANIEYVCGGAIGDCSAIQEGASCYSTDIVRQASYAMNSFYYAKGGHRSINCFFNETGTKVRDDPSYGNCVYPS
ncbi:hypothetical protein ZIOFF_050258 [Zingiber officinale]|uniref:X8 domain-containing protein n=1 Tax=Zingiber officinale TaxID=94328 RepID=A0A8J5KGC5_ZINOF|nr:hypothetical protein ZIOFF_050258 [Zingiber officinale]